MDNDAERLQGTDGPDRYLLADPGRRVGDVFVGLARVADERIDPMLLDARSLTALRRMNCATWGDLADKTIGEIWRTPNAGQLTVGRILDAAKSRSRSAGAGPWSPAVGPSDDTKQPSGPPRGLTELHQVVVDLASWAVRERRAERLADLIHISQELGRVPDEIRRRYESVASASLTDFGASVTASLPASLLDDLLEAVGERVDILVARRIRLHKRPTLQELGEELGVTRERVRQLEVAVANAASRELRSDQFAPLRWRASDLREVLGGAVPASSATLRDALEWATRDFNEPTDCSKEELLLWLAGPYKVDGAWLVLEGASLKELGAQFDAELGDAWLVSEDAAIQALESTGVSSDVLQQFLAEATRLRQIDEGVWVRWEGSLGNKAEVVLRLIGSPADVDVINKAIGEGHASSSVRNVLASDARFVRLDKVGRYGLAEWGLEEYSGIAQEIRERIQRRGGEVELEELVAEFVSKFAVSETSVRMYAASPAFILSDGRVRLRREDEPYVADTQLSRVRGLYVRPEGEVTVEIEVDRDVLRGSGRQFYEAAAIALDIGPGSRRDFVFRDSSRVVVSWPETSVMGPTLGSVRQAAVALGLNEGERFRLILDPRDGTAQAVPIDSSSLAGLTGLEIDRDNALTTLATAMGVDVNEVRAALRARGDEEVLQLLPAVRPSEDLAAAIVEFGDLLI